MPRSPIQAARSSRSGATATPLLTLGLGLAVGWLGATALLGSGPAGPRPAESGAPAGPADGLPTDTGATPEALAAAPGPPVVAAPAGAPSRRVEVGREEAALRSDPEGPPAELSPGALGLQAELRDFLASPELEGYLLQSEERGARFLFDHYLKIDDPLAALSLMERSSALDLGRWGVVANALRQDHPGMANRALELGVRAAAEAGTQWQSPLSDWLVQLEQNDAARALAVFEQIQAGLPADNADSKLAQARLLRKGRRAEESRALLMELIASDQKVVSALSELGRVDPETAEQELVTRLEAEPANDNLRGELLTLLGREGRTDDALALIDSALAEGRMNSNLYDRALANLPSSLIAREVDGWIERNAPGQKVLGKLAAHFEKTGDVERALGYAEDAWGSTIDGRGNYLPKMSDALLAHDRGRVLANLDRARSNAGKRDEVWGDVGDHYWRLGQWDDAIAAYRQARELDPGDSEWRNKVSRIDRQESPWNGAGSPTGWN